MAAVMCTAVNKHEFPASEKSLSWKEEMEAFIMAAKDLKLFTKNYQTNNKIGANPICKSYENNVEIIYHLVPDCLILTQKYSYLYDKTRQYINLQVRQYWSTPNDEKFYEHHPKPVIENHEVIII